MTTPTRCLRCGATLPPDTAPESCPKCLVRIGLERTEPGGETKTSVGAPERTAPEPAELAADFPQLEILELLGQGGMGAVYKARQKSLDRIVALKILAVPDSAGPDFAERFSREARALASLSHSSIVTVYDFGKSGERYFLLMEYVDGANLHRLIHDGAIKPAQALELVSHLCDALQFAHESGVVHRDIKPENILVDRKGRVKIADFGLAKILGRAADPTRLTGAHQVMGTAHYMAPEQLERPLEVDHRADIYSLGVVFYELLTGELPIGRFQPPSRKIEVDVRIDDVVLKTLAKEPQLRYQHASEVKTDIDGISAGAAPRVAVRPAGRSWLPWVITAVTVFVICAFTLIFLRLDRQPDTERPTADVAVGEPSDKARARRAGPLTIAASRGDRQMVVSLLEAGADVNEVDAHGTTPLSGAVDRGAFDVAQLLLERGAEANVSRRTGVTSLMVAAGRGDLPVVKLLIEAGADVSGVDNHGMTALSAAADRGAFEVAQLLLEHGAEANVSRQTGVTPLMVAAGRGDLPVVELLLEAGADVTAVDNQAMTALSAAVDRGAFDVAQLLLEAGVDVNVARQTGVTPLMIAAARGDLPLVELLLEAGADVTAEDNHGMTALSAAVDRGNAELVERLLAAARE